MRQAADVAERSASRALDGQLDSYIDSVAAYTQGRAVAARVDFAPRPEYESDEEQPEKPPLRQRQQPFHLYVHQHHWNDHRQASHSRPP